MEYYFVKKDPSKGQGVEKISLRFVGELVEKCVTIKCDLISCEFFCDDTSFYLCGITLLNILNMPDMNDRRVEHVKYDNGVQYTYNLLKARKMMKQIQLGLIEKPLKETQYERKLTNLSRRLVDGIDREGLDKHMHMGDDMALFICKEAYSDYVLQRDAED